MGAHTIPSKMEKAVFPASGRDCYVDKIGYLRAWGTTVPTDGGTGYAPGCLFQHTDGGNGTALYVNEGTVASCDFNAVTVA